ncbi:multiubiquitin domain-containing protein [Xanthomonas campestris]|uniref:multiubiquitin domain-containing protein n=1 Tax=Xanthomonas campestris TaxID=339 RepID=UPI0023682F05|nr:multiubiquitin domain-containing protein [Xanthomonas campestris]MEA9762494.1 multiubiquitin domain-containing protein [Xanthomonas campestris pv. raphani]MEA9814792.1 multiubiquitin domain-containing protein [Xanthomonas campestris pv. raphani]MEA9908054.1 multiubiquitin domain-containing protein [Xanthomonas campestris pv. raphani]MEA9924141.1 multiubiquitin domain-containing protein [Xanthomonas campestris pv. raphani]MEA9936833.1 multiubiquitin domain-containing protein [Xanthomonas cam
MTKHDSNAPPDHAAQHDRDAVRVNETTVELNDRTPTGAQILAAARLRPAADYALIRWPEQGPTNEIALDDVVNLPLHGPLAEFFAVKADGVRYFTLDEERYVWAGPLKVETVRRLGRVDEQMGLWLELTDEEDRLLAPGEVIDLESRGVERLYTKKPSWHLQIRDRDYEFDQPQVIVRDALIRAGFDVSKSWEVKFKVKNQPIRPVKIEEVLDLSQPGVERLRVAPANVDNGDGIQDARRDFSLLPNDASFLSSTGLYWQTIIDGSRWLVVEGYPLPAGYNVPRCVIAIEIPESYPTAQLDMFFCSPQLTANGAVPPQTEQRQLIANSLFQRWSRHRGVGSEWTPGVDNLESHFALIEHAITREVGA